MTPKPHVCSVCKKEVVWTDCLPATCYFCNDAISTRRVRIMVGDAAKLNNKVTEQEHERRRQQQGEESSNANP